MNGAWRSKEVTVGYLCRIGEVIFVYEAGHAPPSITIPIPVTLPRVVEGKELQSILLAKPEIVDQWMKFPLNIGDRVVHLVVYGSGHECSRHFRCEFGDDFFHKMAHVLNAINRALRGGGK